MRGFCPEAYLREDVFWSAVGETRRDVFDRYFSLDEESWLAAQIRHTEDPSHARRWRGEFMIHIKQAPASVLTAEFWRAKKPLRVQLHEVLQRLYPKIAAAFAKSDLRPDSDEWAQQVRNMVPTKAQLVAEIVIEHLATSNEDCPALETQLGKAQKLTLPPPTPPSGTRADGVEYVRIALHAEWYDVVLYTYPRRVHVNDADADDPYFAWAEETVGALEPCWKPVK